jgi:hypothetical protein
MATETSIYPITQVYMRCDGCGAEWMVRPDPPIENIEGFKAFTSSGGTGPCPKLCGSRTCSLLFKAGAPTPGANPVDPFSLFNAPAEPSDLAPAKESR